MGLYLTADRVPVEYVRSHDLPVLAWLTEEQKHTTATPPEPTTRVFWQQAPWGENAAIGYTKREDKRLLDSGVFTRVFHVHTSRLRERIKF